jgi:hypothetical protein
VSWRLHGFGERLVLHKYSNLFIQVPGKIVAWSAMLNLLLREVGLVLRQVKKFSVMFNRCSKEPVTDSRTAVVAPVGFKCGFSQVTVVELFITDFQSMAIGERLRHLR